MTITYLSSSFRDPSSRLFRHEGVLYRRFEPSGLAAYNRLMTSGLYEQLTRDALLLPHDEEIPGSLRTLLAGAKLIRPEMLKFVSYPYEWCFSQLKDAALLTLAVQKRAISQGLSLKDASAFNVQFRAGRPVFIDTGSFELYEDERPWSAYRQFCRHFLAPLALLHYRDERLQQLWLANLDGIPLDLALNLLPWRSRLRLGLTTHLHVHAHFERRYESAALAPREVGKLSRHRLEALLDHLESTITALRWRAERSVWADYYAETNYSQGGMAEKKAQVERWIAEAAPSSVWDLGANVGDFSRLAAARKIPTVSFDFDYACVELNYQRVKRDREQFVLPLVSDLTVPTPAIGWSCAERSSFFERGPADLVLCLALIHHLAIGNNVPLDRIAEFLAQVGRTVILEFVPKEDSQVARLLASRADVFPSYTLAGLKEALRPHFEISAEVGANEEARRLLLLRRR